MLAVITRQVEVETQEAIYTSFNHSHFVLWGEGGGVKYCECEFILKYKASTFGEAAPSVAVIEHHDEEPMHAKAVLHAHQTTQFRISH